MIAVLANKYPIETLGSLMESVEQTLTEALANIKTSTSDEGAKRLTDTTLNIFALASGLLRRHTGKAGHKLLRVLQTVPADAQTGFHLGRRLEMIIAPQRFLTKESFAVVRPLWLQKLYIELVKPMLDTALGSTPSPAIEPLIKAHFSLATLLMVKNLSFSIYEADASKILRIAIGCAQNFGCSSEGMAALEVIKNVLVEAPEQAQEHIRSLIKICTGIFTNRERRSDERPDWLPAEYTPSIRRPDIEAGCGKLSLEIVGGLPRMFEARHLLAYEPQVQRDLSTACGHRIRHLRGTARLARGAWADVK